MEGRKISAEIVQNTGPPIYETLMTDFNDTHCKISRII